jgi:hypothetical protein
MMSDSFRKAQFDFFDKYDKTLDTIDSKNLSDEEKKQLRNHQVGSYCWQREFNEPNLI